MCASERQATKRAQTRTLLACASATIADPRSTNLIGRPGLMQHCRARGTARRWSPRLFLGDAACAEAAGELEQLRTEADTLMLKIEEAGVVADQASSRASAAARLLSDSGGERVGRCHGLGGRAAAAYGHGDLVKPWERIRRL